MLETLKETQVFQTDSEVVINTYRDQDNYLIEYDEFQNNEYCAIYFSSNDIYYPNNEIVFRRSILEKNKFEWFTTRVPYAHKHIFIRDIHKQWYLTGVNSKIDSPDKLAVFLKTETEGYKVITIGSSAGGFAAVLFGSLLKAQLILSFNGQFQIHSLLKTSNESVDPILFRLNKANKSLIYFDTKFFSTDHSAIFYFYSNLSKIDRLQKEYIKDIKVNIISFSTSHHGIPFLKCNLPVILKMTKGDLLKLSGAVFSPFLFSIKMVGLVNSLIGFFQQLKNKYL